MFPFFECHEYRSERMLKLCANMQQFPKWPIKTEQTFFLQTHWRFGALNERLKFYLKSSRVLLLEMV